MPRPIDTEHAKEIAPAVVELPDGAGEARLERLLIKATGTVEIRLSWWKGQSYIPQALELPEPEFLKLLGRAIRQGVLLTEG